MNSDFQYVVDPSADEPIMLLNTHIGYSAEDGQGIDGAKFQTELLCLDTMGKKRIQVWINSAGGSVVDGMSVYNAISKTKTKVDTYCAGLAASISAVIFQAGRRRVMADYGILMFHNPSGGDSEALNAMNQALITMTAHSGMSRSKISEMMNATTFLTADEALHLGLADEIEASNDFNTKRAPSKISAYGSRVINPREMRMVLNSCNAGIQTRFHGFHSITAAGVMAELKQKHKQK